MASLPPLCGDPTLPPGRGDRKSSPELRKMRDVSPQIAFFFVPPLERTGNTAQGEERDAQRPGGQRERPTPEAAPEVPSEWHGPAPPAGEPARGRVPDRAPRLRPRCGRSLREGD